MRPVANARVDITPIIDEPAYESITMFGDHRTATCIGYKIMIDRGAAGTIIAYTTDLLAVSNSVGLTDEQAAYQRHAIDTFCADSEERLRIARAR